MAISTTENIDRMRVLFYDHGSGSLGIQYLMAVLQQQGYQPLLHFDTSPSKDYRVKDLWFHRILNFTVSEITADILARKPSIVCFSLPTHFFKQALELICEIKRQKPEICIICGGIHATLVPERVIVHPEIDFLVRGEGEISFMNLIKAIERHGVAEAKALSAEELPGVWTLRDGVVQDRGLSPLVPDLDTIPFPDKQLHREWNPRLTRIYTMLASRGCFYGCTYCNSVSVRNLYDACGLKYYRVKSVSAVIEELKNAKRLYNPTYVEFYDDVFGADIRWLREFAERFPKDIGLPFGIQTNPTAINEERIELLASAGCVTMELGFQTANAIQRETVLNRRDNAEGVRRLIREALRRGIFVELGFLVNLPHETPQHIEEVLEFIRTARPKLVNLSFLQFYPKTKIIEMAVACGLVEEEEIRRIEEGERLQTYRLPPESHGRIDYHLLPLQAALATALPPTLSRGVSALVRLPGIRRLIAVTARPFVYAYRFWMAVRSSRAHFMRWQTMSSLYNLWAVVSRRLRGRAFREPVSASHDPHSPR